MSSRRILFAGVSLFALLAGGWLLLQRNTLAIELPGIAEEGFEDEVRELLADYSPAEVYQRIAHSLAGLAADKQHVIIHRFAAVLYEQVGIRGFAACDHRFQYGCYHELMGRAIAEHGFTIVPSVYEACTSVPLPLPFACLHGIGHGLIASTSYTREGLDAALALCDDLAPSAILATRCHQGVFMEYNQRPMLGAEAFRPLGEEEDYYEPCTSISPQYQEWCYFELAAWWYRLAVADTRDNVFAWLGERCREVGEEGGNIRACFEGVGTIATPHVRFDAYLSKGLCETVSPALTHQLFCKSAAALSLAVGAHPQTAAILCEGLSGPALGYCRLYADNQVDFTGPPAAPVL